MIAPISSCMSTGFSTPNPNVHPRTSSKAPVTRLSMSSRASPACRLSIVACGAGAAARATKRAVTGPAASATRTGAGSGAGGRPSAVSALHAAPSRGPTLRFARIRSMRRRIRPSAPTSTWK